MPQKTWHFAVVTVDDTGIAGVVPGRRTRTAEFDCWVGTAFAIEFAELILERYDRLRNLTSKLRQSAAVEEGRGTEVVAEGKRCFDHRHCPYPNLHLPTLRRQHHHEDQCQFLRGQN